MNVKHYQAKNAASHQRSQEEIEIGMWARIQGEVLKERDLEPVLQLVLEFQAHRIPVQLQCPHWRKQSIRGELESSRLFLDRNKSSL